MSWKDEEIDALFKGATPPPPPPFEDSFWAEMETMLPEKKRRKPIIFWISGIAAVLAVGVGIALWPDTDQAAFHTAEAQEDERSMTPEQKADNGQDSTLDPNEPMFAENQTAVRSLNNAAAPMPGCHVPTIVSDCQTDTWDEPLPRKGLSKIDGLRAKQFANSTGQQLIAGFSPVPHVDRENDVPEEEKDDKFYAQLAVGAGQSPMKTGSSEFLHYYLAGAGIMAKVEKFELSYGLQFRMDVAENVDYTLPGVEYNRVTSLRNLYSLETPLSLGLPVRKGVFAVNVVPGFQMGFSGRYTDYQNEVALKSARIPLGKPMEARTLTLEMGVGYRYNLKKGWQLGAALATDAIRPFYSTAYFGTTRLFPVNGQVVLRRTF